MSTGCWAVAGSGVGCRVGAGCDSKPAAALDEGVGGVAIGGKGVGRAIDDEKHTTDLLHLLAARDCIIKKMAEGAEHLEYLHESATSANLLHFVL